MKLFRTNDMSVDYYCQPVFQVDIPVIIINKKRLGK